MKKLLFILALCLTASWSFAQEQRIDPPRNIKQAPGANYVLLSDGPGNFQIVPAASLPGGGGGDVITNFTYNGSDLTITTDQDVFAVNVDAGTVETTIPISINGTAYPSGTDIQTILGAIGTAIDNIGLVDNGDGTYTFTDTDGSTVTINTGGGGATVTASNGLNDQDTTSDVDVELGGTLDKKTSIDMQTFGMQWDASNAPNDTLIWEFLDGLNNRNGWYLDNKGQAEFRSYSFQDPDGLNLITRTTNTTNVGDATDPNPTRITGNTIELAPVNPTVNNSPPYLLGIDNISGEVVYTDPATFGGGGGATVSASNGLNDQGATSDVDVELGGTLDKNTDVVNTDYLLRFGQFTGLERSYLQQNGIANSVAGFTFEEQTGGGPTEESGFIFTPGFFQFEADAYDSNGGNLTRLMQIDASFNSGTLGFLHLTQNDTMEMSMSDAGFDIFASNGLDLDSKTGITFYDGKYSFPEATPGAGQKVMVWNSGTPSFEDYSAGGGGPTIGSITGGGATVMVKYTGTAPTLSGSSGNWTITVPSGTILDWFRWNGNNSFLTAGGDMNITVQWVGVSFNTSQADAVIPDITLVERTTTLNQQLDVQGAGWNVTCPNAGIGGGATTSVISGLNGFGGDWTVIGEF